MRFGHEKLDVYRLAIKYVKFSYTVCDQFDGKHRNARDQLIRASQSIPLNIAEGDRRRYFEIARGSTLECAAIQDVLEACDAIDRDCNKTGRAILDRIVAMLTKLGGRGYAVREDLVAYEINENDSESDSDADPDTE